jgi:hypothetical protein
LPPAHRPARHCAFRESEVWHGERRRLVGKCHAIRGALKNILKKALIGLDAIPERNRRHEAAGHVEELDPLRVETLNRDALLVRRDHDQAMDAIGAALYVPDDGRVCLHQQGDRLLAALDCDLDGRGDFVRSHQDIGQCLALIGAGGQEQMLLIDGFNFATRRFR